MSILDQADISIIPNQGANPGLLFDFNGKLTIGGGGGPPPIATPLISFQVATIDGQSTITGASVTLTSGLGDVFIDKGLCKDAQCDNLIEDIFVNPSIPSASTNIPPQNQIFVLDGLSLAASGAVPAPFIDTFEQHFYVTAPEPSTVILIIIGLAGFGVGIRRSWVGIGPRFPLNYGDARVGWVERSETHHSDGFDRAMGFTSFYPSYGLRATSYELCFKAVGRVSVLA